MNEKNTEELTEVLGKTHISGFDRYCSENRESMNTSEEAFSLYMKELLAEKKSSNRRCF